MFHYAHFQHTLPLADVVKFNCYNILSLQDGDKYYCTQNDVTVTPPPKFPILCRVCR